MFRGSVGENVGKIQNAFGNLSYVCSSSTTVLRVLMPGSVFCFKRKTTKFSLLWRDCGNGDTCLVGSTLASTVKKCRLPLSYEI